MGLFGLIGFPLAQSFSKKYFTARFENEGLTNCRYELFEIPGIHLLPAILRQNPELQGLNVTIPYKKEVLAFLDDRTAIPADLDACNCIRISNGVLTGFNTDVTGFEKSFTPELNPQDRRALVLGNGGATSAVTFVLRKLGIDYLVVSRSLQRGAHLTYQDLDAATLNDHTVIINTTPLGSYPKTGECPAIPYDLIGPHHYLFDVVYNPSVSLFLEKGRERGARIKNGYDWLIIQAEESWRIWNEGISV